ncbi:MAG: class F sortase [Acidimicrobiales bacterium]
MSVAVPDIGVESSLLHLGLRPDGSAEVPDEFALASWYRHGGRPGGHGPTVVLGHVDSTDGPAVFARLRELAPGDRIEITLEDGTVAIYAMTGSIEFHKDAVPTREVFGATVDDVLRLITCSGPFDRAASSYTENLVVNAERVGTRSAP